MKSFRYIAVFILLYVSHSAYADSFNVQLTDSSARFLYAAEVFGGEFGPTDLEVGAYFNEDDDTVAHVSLLLRSDSLDNPLVASIGGRFYYGDVGNAANQTNATVAAFTLGVSLRYAPANLGNVGFSAYYFISPSVTTFLDADTFREYGIAIDLDVTEQVGIYLGYRNMNTDLDAGGSVEIDDSIMYGVLFRF